jgi:hypothetical protein
MSHKKNANHSKRGLKATLLTSLPVLALLLTNPAAAQNWRFDPVLKIGADFDDNAELSTRTDQEIDLQGTLFNAAADINYNSDATTFNFSPRFVWRKYPDNPELESDDIFVRSVLRRQLRNSSLGFRLKYDNQSVRTAERADTDLDIEDPDEIEDDDTGRVTLRGDREALRVAPFWDFRFSERSTLGTQLSYRAIRYDDVFAGALEDFDDIRANISYRYGLSNRNTAIVTATGRQFETADGLNESTGSGIRVGVERSFTENTTLRGMIGVESAERNNTGSESATVGELVLIRRLETIRLLAGYVRSITGTGAGRLSVRDAFNLNFTRQLSEKISAGLGVRAYQSRGLGASQQIDDRNYIQLRSNFIWYLSQSFSLEFDYRYTNLNRIEVGERANSNGVNIWFAWHPNRTVRTFNN